MESTGSQPKRGAESRRRSGLSRASRWIVVFAAIAAIALAIAVDIALHRADRILKNWIVETLSATFDGRVDLDSVDVSVAKGLTVSGKGLRIFPPEDVIASGVKAPLISVGRFSFHVNIPGLFISPMRVGTVYVGQMEIDIPPKSDRKQVHRKPVIGKVRMVVQQVVFDDSELIMETDKPNKEPRKLELKHIVMRDVGPNNPWLYDATLINSIPVGTIHATGTFGPWVNDGPGDSTVTGHYTFEHADLNTIKGIGGMLSSVGDFKGQLDRIEVDGTTETPDFSLDTANNPVPLHTEFHAIVDGTSGDTYLKSVRARLGTSDFVCNGTVVNVKGRGHIIDLDANVPHGKVQDFLSLAIAAKPAMMTGMIEMKAHLHFDPGTESVSRKMRLRGLFALRAIHFTDPATEDKIDMLSLRTSGHPREAKPGAPDVHSRVAGEFAMAHGELRFNKLDYDSPGARVELTGVYSLTDQRFDFSGTVKTDARLSQMVSTRWKSWLLKPVDPFFAKHGAGASIPIRISGTRTAPKIGVRLSH